MIKNHIWTALRSLMRSQTFFMLNIAGLSAGVAYCLLVALYVHDEMPDHQKNRQDLSGITSVQNKNDLNKEAATLIPNSPKKKNDLPEIQIETPVINSAGVSQNPIRYDENQFYESDGHAGDSVLFDIFTYEFKKENPKKTLV